MSAITGPPRGSELANTRTFVDWVAGVAAHDDNHLAQLERALPASP